MKTTRWRVGLTLFGTLSVAVLSASDRVAFYTRVDRVVMEPNAQAPERIQIWGLFSMAKPNDPNDYLPPARGYLYFALGANAQTAKKEWSDLQSVAGTGQIVALGTRWESKARVRSADEKPANPDPYLVGVGLTRITGRTDYAPIRALLDARP